MAAVRGPVRILAGAGSGKTTTLTRRIAHQVACGAFDPPAILAVTFTDKAAREMETRLVGLGVRGVRVRTFHAEALAQHGALTGSQAELLPSKAPLLLPLTQRLPAPHKFVGARDIAGEIEWARNRRIPPQAYPSAVGDRVPPIPVDLMAGVYGAYERRKRERGVLDFEDLLERTLGLLEAGGAKAEAVRQRYRAFSVDEYQDVNLLQQSLLDAWVGERHDVCVVGDDYQSIFGFTGASATYLVDFPKRFPGCTVVQLTANYRSTQDVLDLANRLAHRFGPSPRMLTAGGTGAPAPAPGFHQFTTGGEEVAWIVAEARRLHATGVAWQEMAVLYRINGRSEPLEAELAAARIPYQVAGAAFLRRPAARSVLPALRKAGATDVLVAVDAALRRVGWRPGADLEAAGDEATRQADLSRLHQLALEYAAADDPSADPSATGFVADLQRRFAAEEDGRGIQILTYHRAKGKEFDAVFLPRLEDKELPFALATSPEDRAEERRLFYVGITRARRHLYFSYAATRDDGPRRRGGPSPFLAELLPPEAARPGGAGLAAAFPASSGGRAGARSGKRADAFAGLDPDLVAALREWRRGEAAERAMPPYIVFSDATLAAIAASRPTTPAALLQVSGVGPKKAADFGDAVLKIVASHPKPAGA